jgi:phage-related baseplate assembly protein
MVEPIPFVASVANLTRSQGGAPEETDDAYRERVRVAPNSFSVAGPEDAYVYWAKTASAAISDVSVLTDEAHPGTVYVRPLLAGGEIPGVEVLELVGAALSNKTRRPLTDYVVPALPSAVTCDVAFTYWIDSKDARRTETIQAAVSTAVTNYLAWQRAALGRDVNPDQLRFMVIAAGAKRLTVTAPAFAALTRAQVAQDGTVAVTYGGLEDA